jgi:hypothetical protein
VLPYATVKPYRTSELAASLVVQVIVAPEEVMLVAATLEMTGGVVSPGGGGPPPSIVQVAEQPSPAKTLPSSQVSGDSMTLLPQMAPGTVAETGTAPSSTMETAIEQESLADAQSPAPSMTAMT